MYFTTKEGLSNVTAKPITNNIPLPPNAAVYDTPIQQIDKINDILNGLPTDSDILHEEIDRQNQEIEDFYKKNHEKIITVSGEMDIKDNNLKEVNSKIATRQDTINDYNDNKIPYANAVKSLCNINGPSNIIKQDITVENIMDYINLLDTIYLNLKTINTELITTYNNYKSTPTTYTKPTVTFKSFPPSIISDAYNPTYKIT